MARLQCDQLCVGWDVKPCSLSQLPTYLSDTLRTWCVVLFFYNYVDTDWLGASVCSDVFLQSLTLFFG